MVGLDFNKENLKQIYLKANKNKKTFFYLFTISLIILVFSIVSKSWTLVIILSLIFVFSLLMYIYNNVILNKLYIKFKDKCPLCNKEMKHINEIRYLTSNAQVSKEEFALSLEQDKKILDINKYVCFDDNFCFLEMITYSINKIGDKKVYKKQFNVDFDYHKDY